MDISAELLERGFEKSTIFLDPSYEGAIIGISTNGNVCYSYEKMITWLVEEYDMDEEEAVDFIDYATIRTLDYMWGTDSDSAHPIIIYDIT